MPKIKLIFFMCFMLLLGRTDSLYSCPLCLSMPKNTDQPFFIDGNNEYTEHLDQLTYLQESSINTSVNE